MSIMASMILQGFRKPSILHHISRCNANNHLSSYRAFIKPSCQSQKHLTQTLGLLSPNVNQRLSIIIQNCRNWSQVRNVSKTSAFRQQAGARKLPFEVDGNVSRDTLLFQFKNDPYYRMLTIFGIVQFLFWVNMGGFAYSSLRGMDVEQLEEKAKDNFWGRLLLYQAKYKNKVAAISFLLAYGVLLFAWIYPQRTVTRLLLLRGGDRVKVETYTHFAKKKNFIVPLNHISVNQTRETRAPQVSMKIKNKWFYYQLDKRTGKFYETNLFDYVVGLKRDLK